MTVASVAITSPALAPTFGALGHSVQFSAVAKDAAGAAISGAAIAWASSNTATATVSGSGLVTAAGNGTTQITASSGGQTSTFVLVTVQQVPVAVNITPASVAFGAIGSTRQLSAAMVDSANAPITGLTVTWAGASSGKTTLSASGLLTAVAITAGTPDTVHAQVISGGTFTGTATVTVQQVVASITVTSPNAGPDTLKTTTRTLQYTATAKDSNNNAIANPTVTWTSTTTAAATIGSTTGLATAVADGNTNITATAGVVNGLKALVVRRYASTFTISPTFANLSNPPVAQIFTGTAQDSVSTSLPITWSSSAPAVATVNPGAGTSTTATAASNGTTNVQMAAGTRTVTALVTVSNVVAVPGAITVNVGDDFFTSTRNLTTNPSVDTVAIGGQVTWHWVGSGSHSVQSTGVPSFASSGIATAGNYVLSFNTAGTFNYNCVVHGSAMTGIIIVK